VTALQTLDVIALWPDAVGPGSEQLSIRETVTERSHHPCWPDRILTGITRPRLTAFIPRQPNGTAVIIAPGGAYGRIVLDKESAEMALWLNTLGITSLLMHYRLPAEGHADGPDAPFADAQHAIRVLRQNAVSWGLDPARIGFLGCSAGGHLGAMLGTQFDRPVGSRIDDFAPFSARPDFMLLLYPVISMTEPHVHRESRDNLLGRSPSPARIHRYSAENWLRPETPPCFLAVADDDDVVSPENSRLFHAAALKTGVDCTLHRFNRGGHGFGIRDARDTPAHCWTTLAAEWLASHGFLAN